MRYLSICSGIEAATVAWHPLGMTPAGFAEIDAFPSAVLAHHYPDIPNFGDFTKIKARDIGPIDILVGGTPCQSFSIAGLRAGLADDRGNLALEFLLLAERLRSRWLVWENVPGVLSQDGGRAFGAILGGMVECGYGFAYRVLDAQYFGLAQRRKRVFVVGYLGDWRRAAAVLFERESLSWNPPPRSKVRAAVAALTANGVGTCGADDSQGQAGHLIAMALNTKGGSGRGDAESETFVTHSLRAEGFDASEDGTGRGIPLVATPILEIGKGSSSRGDGPNGAGIGKPGDPMFTLQAGAQHAVAYRTTGNDGVYELGDLAGCLNTGTDPSAQVIAFDTTQVTSPHDRSNPQPGGVCHTLSRGMHPPSIASKSLVRRLTPRECERLQGFPDDYTLIPHRGKPAADGPRYRALGNSMAVPVMAWLGRAILATEAT